MVNKKYFKKNLIDLILKITFGSKKKLKIPPPILVIILITSIYFSSDKLDLISIPYRTSFSIVILSIGILVIINPVVKFIKSKTTVNPVEFKNVEKLVTSGIYKYSRNPMYLGMIMIIISTTVYYLNFYSLLTPFIFYFWINRFQIKREEVFLEEKFGQEYLSYKTKTRRWI
tara:strand:- start:92548 stop:93063 length:516 start_codon:yes stop_codon:yes gene_type:complete